MANTALISVVLGILNVLSILVLVGLVIMVGVMAKGKGAVAAIVGLLLLVAERLLAVAFPWAYNALGGSSRSFSVLLIVQNVVLTVVSLIGIVLLALGVVWMYRDRRPSAGAGGVGPPGPRPPYAT